MMSSKKKAIILSGLFTLCAVLTISTVCIGGDDATKKIKKQRPNVAFTHDSHMGNYECQQCHHRYENGKNVIEENQDELMEIEPEGTMTLDVNLPDDASAIKCASCHNNKTVTKIKSREAFHGQCIGCHEKEAKGPVLCGECHKR
jgi:hypothetical protein